MEDRTKGTLIEQGSIHYNRLEAVQRFLKKNCVEPHEIINSIDLRDGEVAFFSGSITDGLGDDSSDLDVFILTDEGGFKRRAVQFDGERVAQQQNQQFGIIYFTVGNAEFDAEIHRRQKYLDLFKRFDALDALDRSQIEETFSAIGPYSREEATSLLHRVRTGVAISDNEEFQTLLASFDDSKFLLWSAHFHLIEAQDFIKGTSRSLKNGDAESACLKLRRAYDSIVDAAIYASGESIDRWKWRLPKLRRICEPDLLSSYREVNFEPNAVNFTWLPEKRSVAEAEVGRISQLIGIN